MSDFKILIYKYIDEDIFNMGMTRFVFWVIPHQTYAKKQTKQQARGKKGIKAKYRISLYVDTNSRGTIKIPLGIIGKSKNPC